MRSTTVTLRAPVEVAGGAPRASAGKRVRVAFCIDNMGIGGTELNALRTAERLDRSRFDVSVVCLQDQGPLLARYRKQGIPVLTLPVRRLHGFSALRQGVRFCRYLVRQRVDIVHSHDVYNNIFATSWARLARTPVVIASRRWWDDVPRAALRIVNRHACRFADCVIANSRTVADLLVTEDRMDGERVAVISNFVDESAFTPPPAGRIMPLADLGVPPESIVIGCVAGLRPVKDHQSLIAAIAALRPRWPSVRLVLVGDGEARPSLERLTRQLGLADVVHFAGIRANEPNLHHLFDISVLCSVSEAFPNSIVEAMAAGKPVVATRVGGIVDAVADGRTGLLVAPRDPTALASAIEQLLIKPERRRDMGRAGARRARAQFHVNHVLPSLESLYDRLLVAGAR
ncbi:MAG TPA: glycosyltransferase [Gemmatimonadaceae bacterium]|nr:glycosyltransferase [Gemmatimonadaceae bacterium]